MESSERRRRSKPQRQTHRFQMVAHSCATSARTAPKSAIRFRRASSRFFCSSSALSFCNCWRSNSCVCSNRTVALCQASSTLCKSALTSSARADDKDAAATWLFNLFLWLQGTQAAQGAWNAQPVNTHTEIPAIRRGKAGGVCIATDSRVNLGHAGAGRVTAVIRKQFQTDCGASTTGD